MHACIYMLYFYIECVYISHRLLSVSHCPKGLRVSFTQSHKFRQANTHTHTKHLKRPPPFSICQGSRRQQAVKHTQARNTRRNSTHTFPPHKHTHVGKRHSFLPRSQPDKLSPPPSPPAPPPWSRSSGLTFLRSHSYRRSVVAESQRTFQSRR